MALSNVESFPGFDEAPLTQEDFRAVRALLSEVVQDERTLQIAKAVVSWLAAFDVFKRHEAKTGLPISDDSKLAYGGIVGQLKGTGKWILVAVGHNPKVLECLGISYDDFLSRVKELSWDDNWVENPISSAEKEQLKAAFGE